MELQGDVTNAGEMVVV
uniref:Uncharacterized protein n=1 Tax=Arundo donax TaxID=35708 RepID=A0A0A9C674_ARUDO